MTLDLDLEAYRLDKYPDIYYINFMYFKKKNGRWYWAPKHDQADMWKPVPKKQLLPYGLRNG